jgi:Ca2+-binding EF-hand superfamily protein
MSKIRERYNKIFYSSSESSSRKIIPENSEEDNKKIRYNPILVPFEVENSQHIKEHIVPQLYFCINEAARAFELLDIKKNGPILENILYSGMAKKQREILKETKKDESI